MRLAPALALIVLATPAVAASAPAFQKTTIGPVTFLAALHAALLRHHPLLGADDIVMTGGGPGPNSTPFQFGLENLDATLKAIMHRPAK